MMDNIPFGYEDNFVQYIYNIHTIVYIRFFMH